MKTGRLWASGCAILSLCLSVKITAQVGVTPTDIATTLFDKYDANRDGILSVDELTAYEMGENAKYNDPDFRSLKGFKEIATKKAREDAINDVAAVYGRKDSTVSGGYAVNRDDFRVYLLKTNPKMKASLVQSSDFLSRLSGGFLKDSNFHVSRSSLAQKDEKLPAQFSWTVPTNGKSFFTIDGAFSYSLFIPQTIDLLGHATSIEIDPTIEAHTSTATSAQQDSLSAKLMAQFYAKPTAFELPLIESHYLSIAPVYETDRKKKTETYGGEAFYSPSLRPLRVGLFTSIIPSAGVYPGFLWRPYIGFEGGYASQTGGSRAFELTHDYARFSSKVHAELYLTPSVEFAADYYHRTFLSGSGDSFDYIELSPIIYLDPNPDDPKLQHFSIGLTYKTGKTTPQFTQINSISAWLGIRF